MCTYFLNIASACRALALFIEALFDQQQTLSHMRPGIVVSHPLALPPCI